MTPTGASNPQSHEYAKGRLLCSNCDGARTQGSSRSHPPAPLAGGASDPRRRSLAETRSAAVRWSTGDRSGRLLERHPGAKKRQVDTLSHALCVHVESSIKLLPPASTTFSLFSPPTTAARFV